MSLDSKGTSRPNGITKVTPVDVNQDGVTDYIYGGDLFGNLWKFDVTSTSAPSWDVAFHSGSAPVPLFHACGASACTSSNAQSNTSHITVGFGPNRQGNKNNNGTGKNQESADI